MRHFPNYSISSEIQRFLTPVFVRAVEIQICNGTNNAGGIFSFSISLSVALGIDLILASLSADISLDLISDYLYN